MSILAILLLVALVAVNRKPVQENSDINFGKTPISQASDDPNLVNPTIYPEVNFVNEGVEIQPQESVAGWLHWKSADFPVTLYYPENRRASADDQSVGFCQPNSCQEKYPQVSKKSGSLQEVVDRFVKCEIYGICFGGNTTIAPFSIGEYKGIALYFDRLSREEARTQKQTGIRKLPEIGKEGFYYLVVNNQVYEITFDASDQTQRQMISTLKIEQ